MTRTHAPFNIALFKRIALECASAAQREEEDPGHLDAEAWRDLADELKRITDMAEHEANVQWRMADDARKEDQPQQ